MDIKSFIKDRNRLHIPATEYFDQLTPNGYSFTAELIEAIREAQESEDDGLLEDILIAASRDGLNEKYTKVLCALLKDDWHYCQEDIIMMLEEIKAPESVNCIYEAALNIPDYDDGRSLAKKCIWALGAINTAEAKEMLILLTASDDPIVKEAASMQLNQ